MKGLMKASYDGSVMWTGWIMIGLPRESMSESLVAVAEEID